MRLLLAAALLPRLRSTDQLSTLLSATLRLFSDRWAHRRARPMCSSSRSTPRAPTGWGFWIDPWSYTRARRAGADRDRLHAGLRARSDHNRLPRLDPDRHVSATAQRRRFRRAAAAVDSVSSGSVEARRISDGRVRRLDRSRPTDGHRARVRPRLFHLRCGLCLAQSGRGSVQDARTPRRRGRGARRSMDGRRWQPDAGRGSESGTRSVAGAQSPDSSPWFVWVHLFDAHDPYDPPADLKERFAAAPYDGEIAAVDRAVGTLVASVGPDTLVIVAGDHGEALGDHGERRTVCFSTRRPCTCRS